MHTQSHPGQTKPNSRGLFTQLGTTTLTTHARCHPGKGQTELLQDKILLPHYAQQKEEIVRINTSQISLKEPEDNNYN